MAIYTIIGDPHAKPDNLDKINTLFDIIEELGNPCIILGDLLDTKEIIRGRCLDVYLKRLEESKLSYTILVGNHDLYNVNSKEHSLNSLSLLKNVEIVSDVYIKNDIAYIPYIHSTDTLKEMFPKIKAKYLFGHLDVKGFDYGNGIISQEGLSVEDFTHFKKVISGHYHKYSELGNLTYLGSPFSHSFGETDQEKYIGIFNDKTGALELLPTPFPRHITLTWDCDSEFKSPSIDYPEYTRVILQGSEEAIAVAPRLDKVKYLEQPTTSEVKVLIKETDTPAQQFQKWAKEIKGYSDEVVNLGMEVLKDVSARTSL